jgi:hypothetical protein
MLDGDEKGTSGKEGGSAKGGGGARILGNGGVKRWGQRPPLRRARHLPNDVACTKAERSDPSLSIFTHAASFGKGLGPIPPL